MRPVLLALLAVSAAGSELRVEPGAAAGGGDPGSRFATIQAAVDAARPGDRVVVAPGIYREAVVVGHGGGPEAPLELAGEPGSELRGSEPVGGFTRADP